MVAEEILVQLTVILIAYTLSLLVLPLVMAGSQSSMKSVPGKWWSHLILIAIMEQDMWLVKHIIILIV